MYLQNASQQPVYKFKYFTPDTDSVRNRNNTVNHNEDYDETDDDDHTIDVMKKHRHMRSFLDQDSNTFARIRKRLSTLTLNTAYRKGLETPLNVPLAKDSRTPRRRINSISSRDETERKHCDQAPSKARVNSRSSFLSDDKEFRIHRAPYLAVTRNRASETDAVKKLGENFVTPNQDPELFSRHIKLRDKESLEKMSRSTSPRSFKSTESTGKVHLGLIESLDLNERLSDLDKIKARYSNDEFINSLALYKLRGHDRCFNHEGHSEHVRRGTVLAPLDPSRASSKLTWESGYGVDDFLSPRFNTSESDTSYEHKTEAKHMEVSPASRFKPQTPVKRKKSVEFDMEPKDLVELSGMKTPSTHSEVIGKEKELKSILKRTKRDARPNETSQHASTDDEFLTNERYRWKFQLPKIHSPVQNRRPKPSNSFKRKMYHFGDGISREFEQVICTYGNCRQNSIIREKSHTKEQSLVRDSSKV